LRFSSYNTIHWSTQSFHKHRGNMGPTQSTNQKFTQFLYIFSFEVRILYTCYKIHYLFVEIEMVIWPRNISSHLTIYACIFLHHRYGCLILISIPACKLSLSLSLRRIWIKRACSQLYINHHNQTNTMSPP
jgi:hypothetical protein